MIKRYFELINKVLDYHKDANTKLLKKAYSVATKAHLNQERATKEPFIIHPLSVAGILTDMQLDEITISAALLHDVVEDSDYTIDDIKKMFGSEISSLVWGVTKISKLSAVDAINAKAQTIKKMIIAMSDDVRVILIKLADRLHNMSTIEALPDHKRRRIAQETLDIYAPIAHRLGIAKIKTSLENISFKYAYPEEYKIIQQTISAKKEILTVHIDRIKNQFQEILSRNKIKADIDSRIKRPISIFRKIERQKIKIERVYDLLAFRIITDTVENCYAILGEIHQIWKYIPTRWRDHISNPKNNGYRSIHTTVIDKHEITFEVQIRTEAMHKIAEEGIAAHWKYKEGISFIENDKRLKWFREMIDHHIANPNPQEFLNLVKSDLTPDEIYVFTPKGKIISLKSGSTPIDFAYAIHTEIGNKCHRAIVNEILVPIRTKLKSGDVIEIQTSRQISPSIDWLKHVSTHRAYKMITAYINKRDNSILITKGKRIWNQIFQKYKKKSGQQEIIEDLSKRIRNLNYTTKDTFFKDLGTGFVSLDVANLKKMFPRFTPPQIKPRKKTQPKQKSLSHRLVLVEGQNNIEVSLGKCCNPIKGDKIKGYITTNRGLVIHKNSCTNLKNAIDSKIKEVTWNMDIESVYFIKYNIVVDDQVGVLNKITTILANHESNIKDIKIDKINLKNKRIMIVFEVKDLNQLKKIKTDLLNYKAIYSVLRKRIAEQ